MGAAPNSTNTTIINQDTPGERPRLTAAEVSAQWRQNAGGGIGVTILAALAAYWAGLGYYTVALAALTAGGVTFGALMALRSVIDELMDWAAWRDMVADLDAMGADLDAAEQTIADLHARLDVAEREQDRLRFLLKRGEPGRLVSAVPDGTEDADEDAPPPSADVRQLIRVRYESGNHPGKRVMAGWGWTEERHKAAYVALRNAGVVTGSDNAPNWPNTEADALAILARA